MSKVKFFLIISMIYFTSACAGIMNPYKGDFQCPETVNGKCVSVNTAYEESLDAEKNRSKGIMSLQDELKESRNPERAAPESSEYQNALYNRLKGLLKEPVTPMVAPPEVRRVLFLTYTGDGNELFMPRYVYFFVEKPRWILDNYLNSQTKEKE